MQQKLYSVQIGKTSTEVVTPATETQPAVTKEVHINSVSSKTVVAVDAQDAINKMGQLNEGEHIEQVEKIRDIDVV